MNPANLTEFELLIAKPRLDSYRSYFHTRNLAQTIGLYMWNSELSACFGTLIAMFEITLRNKIHRAMSLHYSGGASASFHWYDRIHGQLKPVSVNKIDEVRYEGPPHRRVLRRPQPNPDEIVSRVSFGFWPNVLSSIDRRINFADKILPAIFPHHLLSIEPIAWTNQKKLAAALAFIHELNTFRNRIAHHEPIWKFAALYDHGGVQVHPSSSSLEDSQVRLRRILSLVDEAMYAMSPGMFADLRCSSWRHKVDYLLTERGIDRYRTCRYWPADEAVSPKAFQHDFLRFVHANRPVRVSKSARGGLFVPD